MGFLGSRQTTLRVYGCRASPERLSRVPSAPLRRAGSPGAGVPPHPGDPVTSRSIVRSLASRGDPLEYLQDPRMYYFPDALDSTRRNHHDE